MFASLPIVEILSVGLSGFCFLLAYFAYLLLRREQAMREPNPAILNAIKGFQWFALILAVLVGAVPLFRPSEPLPSRPNSDYLIDATFHRIDLTRFAKVDEDDLKTPKSYVTMDRTDIIRKNSKKEVPFTLPMYTTGLRMEHTALTNSVVPSFKEVETAKGESKKSFEYSLPIGNDPIDHSEVIHNRFTFVNGFRNSESEWWIATVKYPTTALALYFEFPEGKPCLAMTAYRQLGISPKEQINDNPPTISNNGRNAYWIGANEKPDSRIHFEWKW
jgi:hypothetical protein